MCSTLRAETQDHVQSVREEWYERWQSAHVEAESAKVNAASAVAMVEDLRNKVHDSHAHLLSVVGKCYRQPTHD